MGGMDLADFLGARLDEDERVAQEAGRDRHGFGSTMFVIDDDHSHDTIAISSARVLAEVRAKRRIMARHKLPEQADWPEMRILGAVYSDHPDYRPEWKPATRSTYSGTPGCTSE